MSIENALEEDIINCDLVICAWNSTIVYDAEILGKNVIFISESAFENGFILNCKNYSNCNGINDFKKIIYDYKNNNLHFKK